MCPVEEFLAVVIMDIWVDILDKDWESTEEYLQVFMMNIERLIKLVNGFNNIVKLEQTTSVLNKSKFNLSVQLEKIIESFKPIYKTSGLKIHSKLIPNLKIIMDKDKFKQVIYNLLTNALKYSKKSGEVLVTLSSLYDTIIIEIKDNGIGISEKDLPFIINLPKK